MQPDGGQAMLPDHPLPAVFEGLELGLVFRVRHEPASVAALNADHAADTSPQRGLVARRQWWPVGQPGVLADEVAGHVNLLVRILQQIEEDRQASAVPHDWVAFAV